MKRTMILGLMVVLATSANAATKMKKVAKATLPAKTAVTAAPATQAKTESPAVEELPAVAPVVVAPVEAAPAAAQSTTTTTTAEVPKKKFSGDITTWNEQNINEYTDAEKRKSTQLATSDIYLRLRYQLTDKVKVSFGQDLSTNAFNNMADDDHKRLIEYYDPFLAASVGSLAKLPGDINMSGAVRYYAPISQGSRDSGLITQLQAFAVFSKDVTDAFSLSLTLRPRFYINSKSVFADSMNGGKAKATTGFMEQSWLAASYKFSEALSVYQNVGTFEQFTNSGSIGGEQVEATNKTYFYAETGLTLGLGDTFEVSGGVTSYGRNVRARSFTVYGEETNAFLTGTAKF